MYTSKYVLVFLQQCPNRMKTYGAIIEIMKNNNTPINHTSMKKVAKNNVFIFGEDITAPQFFSSTTTKTKQRPRKKSSPYAKTKLRPNSFFTHTAKTKKRTPQKNVRLRRIRRNNNGLRRRNVAAPKPHVAASRTWPSASVAGNGNFDPNVALAQQRNS